MKDLILKIQVVESRDVCVKVKSGQKSKYSDKLQIPQNCSLPLPNLPNKNSHPTPTPKRSKKVVTMLEFQTQYHFTDTITHGKNDKG